MSLKIVVPLLALLVASCKQKDPSTSVEPELAALEKKYQKDKSDSTFTNLIRAYGSHIMEATDMATKEQLARKAVALCKDPDKASYKDVFETELLKINPNASGHKQLLEKAAERMKNNNRPDLASIFYAGLIKKYGESPAYKYNVLAEQTDMSAYLKRMAENVFSNPGPNGVNMEASEKYIDVCEAYALSFPEDAMAAEYLFRASEIARAIGSYPKAMSLYDWIHIYFPKSDKASLAVFFKGFLLDSELGNKDEAKKVYEKFLNNYPQDSMARSVRFLLENLGKSDAEIIKQLEQK